MEKCTADVSETVQPWSVGVPSTSNEELAIRLTPDAGLVTVSLQLAANKAMKKIAVVL